MARPQRSPRMRDHWRDEGSRREDFDYRGRQPERSTDRRRSPVAAKKRERSIDAEVKIKGRASIEWPRRQSPHTYDTDKGRKPSRYPERRSSPSPRRRGQREGSYEHRRVVHKDRYRDHSHNRKSYRQRPEDRRRSRIRSPYQATTLDPKDRPRSPNQSYSRHTGRDVDIRTSHREPRHSTLSPPPRAEYHSVRREDKSTSAGDTYLPAVSRPRSISPGVQKSRELSIIGRRSPVSRIGHPRGSHRSNEEFDRPYYHKSRPRERSPGRTRQPRPSSRDEYHGVAQPRRSRARSRERSERPLKRRRSSWSPPENDSSTRRNRMHSTHRIQVIDSTSRPQSPPRPIPSFGTNGQASSSQLMHTNRPGRPQVNTQHPHAASPHWTPTSSHQASPQSASPYGHGRGGWVGQPQPFHSQPGSVVLNST